MLLLVCGRKGCLNFLKYIWGRIKTKPCMFLHRCERGTWELSGVLCLTDKVLN